MKLYLSLLLSIFTCVSAMAAYQYNVKGNQGWLTFDGDTTVSFDLSRSGKDEGKTQENFIDRGGSYSDYGWYNLDTGASGSFKDGAAATFSENDRIGLWVKDNDGTVYLSNKPPKNAPDNAIWGKSRLVEGNIAIYGGNMGSNGTHEYYVFKVSTAKNPADPKGPSGQPLPGILAVLAVGGAAFGIKRWRDKKRVCDK